MNDNLTPAEIAEHTWLFMKRNVLFMIGGMIICGLIGDFLAGSDGRNLGGGIGFALGMIFGWSASKLRSKRDHTKTSQETEPRDARESPS